MLIIYGPRQYLRFLSGTNKNIMSGSILEVGVQAALRDINWDQDSFHARGGEYQWTRNEATAETGGCNSELAKLTW